MDFHDLLIILVGDYRSIVRFVYIGSIFGEYLATFLLYSPYWVYALVSFGIIVSWPSIYIFIEHYVLPVFFSRALILD